MAKIIFSDGSEIRGRVGGKVYSRNSSGAYVRSYTKPVNPNTALQAASRNNFATVSSAFRSLTDAERGSYEAMRPFYTRKDSVGNTVTPTSAQLFAMVNTTLLQNGLVNSSTLIKICPVPVTLDSVISVAPSIDVTADEMFVNASFATAGVTVPADCRLIVSATGMISAGITNPPAGIFTRVYTAPAAENTASKDIWADYTAQFGVPTAGSTIFVKVQLLSALTGQTSSEVVVPVVVA